MRSNTVFVGGIGKLSSQILGRCFSRFGLVTDIATKQGFAFITFDSAQPATEACNERFFTIGQRKVRLLSFFVIRHTFVVDPKSKSGK